jgi:hypothetical protein
MGSERVKTPSMREIEPGLDGTIVAVCGVLLGVRWDELDRAVEHSVV